MKIGHLIALAVSLATIMTAAPTLGQDHRISFEATGALALSKNSGAEAFVLNQTTADTSNLGNMNGGFGSLFVGVPVDTNWDIGAGFSMTSLSPGSGEYSEPDGSFAIPGPPVFPGNDGVISTDLDLTTMDVEVGYAPELDDNLDVRIFGGARGMYADNSFSATEDKAGTFDNSAAIESEFFGIGPRLGLDLAKRFSDTPFGVSGSVAGAVIFGTAKQTTTIDTGGGPATTESEVSETVVNLETSIGLDYHIANNATVTIGYRGEHFSDVSNFPGGDAEGIWSHGPFLKAKISF